MQLTEPPDNTVILRSKEDVYRMLDDLLQKPDAEWWNRFYTDKGRPVPFFRCVPDENLHSYARDNIFRPGRVLDIGCGNGRNAIYLAKSGFTVDAIDFSQESIDWAKENAKKEHARVNFICDSIFCYTAVPGQYDYVYDSGCLHHIKPHRREQYLGIVSGLLKPDGYFSLNCFNPKGSAPATDYTVYRDCSMHGGMAYSEEKLRVILEDFFEILTFREMREITDEELFGKDFLWTVLMKKKEC